MTAIGDKDVGGLDVSMGNALCMDRLQAIENLQTWR
jgi:hypothetical protein